MQIVIEIPDETKEAFDKASKDDLYGCFYDYNSVVGRAIQNGIPLEPCEDAISRQEAIDAFSMFAEYESNRTNAEWVDRIRVVLSSLPPVTPMQRTGHCKDCKYFEYDSWARFDGIPLIVAHEICSRWGDGCKTKEDGYCFLFEPQESEERA